MTETNPSSSPRYASYPSVAGRAVLVTGGASGIGASIVEHFARQGARVAFLDIEDGAAEQLIAALKVRVESAPIYFRCDLTDIGALQSAVREAVASLGGVDVLVNNAANDQRHKVEDVTPEYWDASIAVNLR
ncbi:MAG: SDR family NAD(P)-dependent oxidoreductase, partial [Terracidiphilus sp.]